MKNYFFMTLFSLLFVSCESTESTELEPTSPAASHYDSKAKEALPENFSNAFDYVGAVHNEVLYAYCADSILPITTNDIIHRVQLKVSSHPYFNGLPIAAYGLIPQSRIDYLASNSNVALAAIVEELPLSLQAKSDFRFFVTAVLAKVNLEEDYQVIHDFILAYETSITTAQAYAPSEKEYLLTVTSIIRHSVYAKKKRPKKNTDPDWDWLTANIAGAVEGAQYGAEQAILTALKTGIIQNSNF